ncbi:PilN domain-containing protein [Candidatus Desulforudis audaxviator]|uniref:Fimbrial assembly family protein n=1 Tax=Desulforudis audaxviator (strain MP104C) TaxID=477974 RepID=B1I3E3_DESAP|nr:fimbrial assembly family protein [Candidatus Desulforudis audaxviator]ACA59488.1 Fimbrial assembly family protein [Candidatus Desulforudis audaxviator MP104C]AZK59471.1 Type IV pilus biogenesis protein PilN [Candidatus Desulforudis audaxviator]
MYKINLLPPELQKDVSVDMGRLKKLLVLAAVFVVLVGSYGSFLWQYHARNAELAQLRAQVALVKPIAEQVDALAARSAENEKRSAELETLLLGQIRWTRLLNDINYNLPADVFLGVIRAGRVEDVPVLGGFASPSGLKADKTAAGKAEPQGLVLPNVITIQGVAQSTASIGVLINNLYSLPYFELVQLKYLEEEVLTFHGHKLFEVDAYLKGADIDVAEPQ